MINHRLIGASDAPAILSVDDYRGPADVYLRVRHGVTPPPNPWLEQAGRLGNRYEEGTARELLHLLGEEADALYKPESRQEPAGYAGLRYSLDFVTARPRVIECKMRRYRGLESWGPPGTGEVALGVAAQVQAQLELIRIDRDWWLGTEIPEVERVDIAVGVDGQEVLHYVVQRDPDLGGAIIEEMRAFWVDHILKGVPPPIDEKSGTRRRLEHELRQASKRVRPASEEEAALAQELLALDEHIAAAERRRDYLAHELMQAIGQDYGIEGEDWRILWRQQRGNTLHKEVADALADRLGLSPGELADIRNHHRSEDRRVFDARKVKPRIAAERQR